MTTSAPPSRRQFLEGFTIAAATLALSHRAHADEPLPIIDTHQHLWDLDKFNLPWLANDKLLHRNYLQADYTAATTGLNVTRAVYMEVAVAPDQREAEAKYIASICERAESPTITAVIAGDPADDDFQTYINRFKDDSHIKGIRSALPPDASTNQTFINNIRYLGKIGWRFDLLTDPTKLKDAARLVVACRETRFILDHCGNASTAFYADETQEKRRIAWEEGLAALADQPNVICKISGVCEAGPPKLALAPHAQPIVDRCIDRFGPDRIVFAGNWPVCLKAVTFAGWVKMLQQITASRTEEFRRKLFHDNAKAFYELK